MKKLILLAIVLTMGCAGGGGGGDGGGDDGSRPVIESVEFYQYVDGERIVKDTFIIDEIFSMQMVATDPDMDMRKYFVDISGPENDQRSDAIPPADTETVEIYDYQNHVYDFADQYGRYTACYWIVDAAGNESDEYCIAITVTDYPTL